MSLLEAGGRAFGTARAALCGGRALTGWRAQAVAPPALRGFSLLLKPWEGETKQEPRAAAQHRFLGPRCKAKREVRIPCSVCTGSLLQAWPRHKLPGDVNGVPILPILSFPRNMQRESYPSSLKVKINGKFSEIPGDPTFNVPVGIL